MGRLFCQTQAVPKTVLADQSDPKPIISKRDLLWTNQYFVDKVVSNKQRLGEVDADDFCLQTTKSRDSSSFLVWINTVDGRNPEPPGM